MKYAIITVFIVLILFLVIKQIELIQLRHVVSNHLIDDQGFESFEIIDRQQLEEGKFIIVKAKRENFNYDNYFVIRERPQIFNRFLYNGGTTSIDQGNNTMGFHYDNGHNYFVVLGYNHKDANKVRLTYKITGFSFELNTKNKEVLFYTIDASKIDEQFNITDFEIEYIK